MEPSRAKEATYRIAFLTGLLLSMAMLLQPTIATADDGDAATVTIPRPSTDTGLREPSSSGLLVIRGTRPVSPTAARSPTRGMSEIPFRPPTAPFSRCRSMVQAGTRITI